MATTYHAAIQALYVAYFNRPADFAGLNYWETVVEAAAGSTAAVSAQFAASAEFKAEYGTKSNAQVINQVYMNLFGRAAEPDGLFYWTSGIAAGNFTVDQAVTVIAKAAGGADKIAYDSKLAVATAFTAALDTPAEQTGYSGDLANAAAKTFLSTIKTAADVTAAIVPATLNASISDIVKASVPFTLATALVALDAAYDAKAAFLAAADGDDDADTSATAADLDAAVAAANVDVGTAVDAYNTDAATGAPAYATQTTAVKAAMVADAQKALAAAVVDATEALADVNEDVADINGLGTAYASFTAAVAAEKAAHKVTVSTDSVLQGAEATYNVLHSSAVNEAANGSYAGLIEVSGGKLVLMAGITETTNKGVTALLAATIAHEAAEKAELKAEAAIVVAQQILTWTDRDVAATDATLDALSAGMTIVHLAAGAQATGAQIYMEQTALAAALVAADKAVTDAGADVTAAQTQTAAEALTAVNDFAALLSDYEAADTTDPMTDADPLVGALTGATEALSDANDLVEGLGDALAGLAEAKAVVTELASFDAAVDAAGEFFTDHDYAVPVSLTGVVGGTSAVDVFVVGDVDAQIVQFGAEAKDILYIGSQYKLNTGKIATAGNNADLEIFVTQSGADTLVTIETVAFGSNSAEPEIVITLTGVTSTNVAFANGILSIA